jgi:hypothetical protein
MRLTETLAAVPHSSARLVAAAAMAFHWQVGMANSVGSSRYCGGRLESVWPSSASSAV